MFEMLLGHLTGDYLLQNQFMAMNKSKNTLKGWLAAFVHCLLYTFAVCLFMWNFHLIWIVVVFCSHFFIDKFGFGEIYMKYIKGNGLRDYINEANCNSNYQDNNIGQDMITGGFKAVVYTLTDNTMHLILMWLGYQILYVW
jgi:hypothetical protein